MGIWLSVDWACGQVSEVSPQHVAGLLAVVGVNVFAVSYASMDERLYVLLHALTDGVL